MLRNAKKVLFFQTKHEFDVFLRNMLRNAKKKYYFFQTKHEFEVFLVILK